MQVVVCTLLKFIDFEVTKLCSCFIIYIGKRNCTHACLKLHFRENIQFKGHYEYENVSSRSKE